MIRAISILCLAAILVGCNATDSGESPKPLSVRVIAGTKSAPSDSPLVEIIYRGRDSAFMSVDLRWVSDGIFRPEAGRDWGSKGGNLFGDSSLVIPITCIDSTSVYVDVITRGKTWDDTTWSRYRDSSVTVYCK